MEFYDAVNNRRSVRDFTDEAIPKEALMRIIDAAYRAPANDHFTDWHFVIVQDKEVMRQVLSGVPQDLTVRDMRKRICNRG